MKSVQLFLGCHICLPHAVTLRGLGNTSKFRRKKVKDSTMGTLRSPLLLDLDPLLVFPSALGWILCYTSTKYREPFMLFTSFHCKRFKKQKKHLVLSHRCRVMSKHQSLSDGNATVLTVRMAQTKLLKRNHCCLSCSLTAFQPPLAGGTPASWAATAGWFRPLLPVPMAKGNFSQLRDRLRSILIISRMVRI